MVISSLLVPNIGAKLYPIGGLQGPHVTRGHRPLPRFARGVRLLRSCTGWAKVLYSCRTVPPLQAAGLCNADRDIHHSLGRLVGSPLSDEAWLPVDLAPAMQLNTLQHLMFPAWPSPKNWVPAFDLVSTSMLSTVVSYEPTRSPP